MAAIEVGSIPSPCSVRPSRAASSETILSALSSPTWSGVSGGFWNALQEHCLEFCNCKRDCQQKAMPFDRQQHEYRSEPSQPAADERNAGNSRHCGEPVEEVVLRGRTGS